MTTTLIARDAFGLLGASVADAYSLDPGEFLMGADLEPIEPPREDEDLHEALDRQMHGSVRAFQGAI